jgi:hypothetical protein
MHLDGSKKTTKTFGVSLKVSDQITSPWPADGKLDRNSWNHFEFKLKRVRAVVGICRRKLGRFIGTGTGTGTEGGR